MERYTYEITFTRLDGQPDEIQQHTSEELARECFRLFDEPDSAEMYSKIELSRHDWETGMDEILETMTFWEENKNMTYTKINLYLANGIPEALSNLWYGSDSAVVEIRDAVEDAKNGKDLLNRIQKMKLLRKFTLDRENDKRIRFKGTDCWGNVSYLEIIR